MQVSGHSTHVTGAYIRVDYIGRYAADLDEAIVLNEYGVAGEIRMQYGRCGIVQIVESC